jgi:hypothetical protein
MAPALASREPRRGCGRKNHFYFACLVSSKERLRMTDTTMMTPLESAARQGAEAVSRFPSDSDDKERRALKAALHAAELRREFRR